MTQPSSDQILQSGYAHPVSRYWQYSRVLDEKLLVYPIFVTDKDDEVSEIASMPGQKHWGVSRLPELLNPLVDQGLSSVILFGCISDNSKDEIGTNAYHPETPVIRATKLLRKLYPQLFICCDVCLCEYTSHGHCGALKADDISIDTPKTLELLQQVSVSYASAGAHAICPSGMIDGGVKAIKQALIENGFGQNTLLISYAAKFASGLYGPFRDAVFSTPSKGDRQNYQLPPQSKFLARKALHRDAESGADMLIVKPASIYLDIVSEARRMVPDHPIAVYHVSGEYAMIVAAAKAGVFDLKKMVLETHDAFLRAGATMIISYFTPQLLKWLKEDR